MASLISTIAAIFGAFGLGLIVYSKYQSGDLFNQYVSMSGLKLSYYQVGFLLLLVPLVPLILAVVEYVSNRDERDFKRKYIDKK